MVKRFEWYKADDEKVHFKRRKPKPTKLKNNIQPGQVLVVLAGRFRGKRVVFLKQLESGLLLVTGPYKINGVPLKRMPQKLTLATSKRIDLNGVDASKINDAYFGRDKKNKGTKEQKFFADGKLEVSAPLFSHFHQLPSASNSTLVEARSRAGKEGHPKRSRWSAFEDFEGFYRSQIPEGRVHSAQGTETSRNGFLKSASQGDLLLLITLPQEYFVWNG